MYQTLLRFNLQPCSLAKPFDEKVVGFTIHDNMNFVVTARTSAHEKALAQSSSFQAEASALPGAYEE